MKASAQRPSLNRDWHLAHRMPAKATLEQRIAWHLAHTEACACRPVPASIRQAVAARRTKAGPPGA